MVEEVEEAEMAEMAAVEVAENILDRRTRYQFARCQTATLHCPMRCIEWFGICTFLRSIGSLPVHSETRTADSVGYEYNQAPCNLARSSDDSTFGRQY